MITRIVLTVAVALLALDIHNMAADIHRLRELSEREARR